MQVVKLCFKIYCRLFYERCFFFEESVCAQCAGDDSWLIIKLLLLYANYTWVCVNWRFCLCADPFDSNYCMCWWIMSLHDLKDDGCLRACLSVESENAKYMHTQLFAQPNWRESFWINTQKVRATGDLIWQWNFCIIVLIRCVWL